MNSELINTDFKFKNKTAEITKYAIVKSMIFQ